jgi:hypothetical protein
MLSRGHTGDRPSAWYATDWFPTALQYALAHECPTCGSLPGDRCVGGAEVTRWPAESASSQHKARNDLGIRQFVKDVEAAPRVCDRVKGCRYGTIHAPAPRG